MFFYAQLNENNVCVGISQLSGAVESSNMISIATFDPDLLWRKYENGQWSVIKYEPQTTAPLSEFVQVKQRVEQAENDNINTMLALTEIYEMILGGS